jgi:predicted nucleic acid-binding protein
VTVVSNSSPLIILAKLECFDLLNRLIPRLYISAEVKAEDLQARGTVGLLETFYLRGHLPDLRATFQQLLRHSYIDQQLLDLRLRTLRLLPL